MTKLMQLLFFLNIFLSIYICLITRQVQSLFIDKWMFEIQILPIILVGLFGLYSVFIVLYRTFTFNDCEEAALELRKQIKEAKHDLKSKGLKFVD